MSGQFRGLLVAVLSVGVIAVGLWTWIRFQNATLKGFTLIGEGASGLPEYRHEPTGIVFVRVPGGTFVQGSRLEGPKSNESPPHEVTLSPFLIAKYEVSQDVWEQVMGNNPSRFQGKQLPVERVSWDDCMEFCRKTGLSLPTDSQWEYACRGGTTTKYWSGSKLTRQQANFAETVGKTVPVDALEPNPFGLHHVAGNVGEWCLDVFDEEFYRTGEAGGLDPICISGPEDVRPVRGGGWNLSPFAGRSASRRHKEIDDRSSIIGMRPVFNVRRRVTGSSVEVITGSGGDTYREIEGVAGRTVFQSTQDLTTWWLVPPPKKAPKVKPGRRVPLGKILSWISAQDSSALLVRRTVFELDRRGQDYFPFLLDEKRRVRLRSLDTEACLAALQKVGVRLDRAQSPGGSSVTIAYYHSEKPHELEDDFDGFECDF